MLKKKEWFSLSCLILALGFLASVDLFGLPRNPTNHAAPVYTQDGNTATPFNVVVNTGAAVLIAAADQDRRRFWVQISSYGDVGADVVCISTFSAMTCAVTSNAVFLSTQVYINLMQFEEFGTGALYARMLNSVRSASATLTGMRWHDTGDDGDD